VKLADCLGKSIVDTKEVKNRVEFLFWDSGVFPANLDESFSMAGIHPHSPTISDNNIGECLNCWNMGCYEEIIETKTKDIFVSVTINTLKHMYHFQMLPNDFYCRAARYKTCNAGVVFNQNFRQRKSDSPETYMVEDNHVSACPLPIDENNFYFNSCPVIDYNQLMEKYLNKREQKVLCYRYGINGSRKMTQKEIASQLGISRSYVSQIQKKARETVESFIPKPADNSIYWSVSSYTDNQILLNGCQGDTYQWNKPDR
jgi:RNA polymerase sigma factor (sigma-70 family)